MAELALVLGATGGLGAAVVRALIATQRPVRAFVRSRQKLEALLHDLHTRVEIVEGDMLHADDLAAATQSAAVIFDCVNVPMTKFELNLQATQVLLDTVATSRPHIVYPGNTWIYGLPQQPQIAESHPKEPISRKGRIKLDIEQMLLNAYSEKQIPVTIVRFPNFYGPAVTNAWMKSIFERAISGKSIYFPGNPSIRQEFIHIDDAARAMLTVAQQERAYGREFNVPGTGLLTPEEFGVLLFRAAGTSGTVDMISSMMISAFAALSKDAREVKEMLYLFEHEFALDGTAIHQAFGFAPAISYEEGLRKTVQWFTTDGTD